MLFYWYLFSVSDNVYFNNVCQGFSFNIIDKKFIYSPCLFLEKMERLVSEIFLLSKDIVFLFKDLCQNFDFKEKGIVWLCRCNIEEMSVTVAD